MDNKTELNKQGLAFARAFQRACRVAVLHSVDHSTSNEPVQSAYKELTFLFQQTRQFVLGFFDRRVVLNESLVSVPSLRPLEEEFFKRHISSVVFSVGLTESEFKRGIAILATPPDVIEQSGGIDAFLRKNQLERMRIVGQKGHFIEKEPLPTDFESFLQSRKVDSPPARRLPDPTDIFNLLLQAFGTKPKAGRQSSYLQTAAQEVLRAAIPGMMPAEETDQQEQPSHLQWAIRRLRSAGTESMSAAAKDEALRVLARALHLSHAADPLIAKLRDAVRDGDLPREILDRMQQELRWSSCSLEQKQAFLLSLPNFTEPDFQHLLEYIGDSCKAGRVRQPTVAAEHYLNRMERLAANEGGAALDHVCELMQVLSRFKTLDFVRSVVARLLPKFGSDTRLPQHYQLANCLATASQCLGSFGEYEAALTIGTELERSFLSGKDRHSACCGPALRAFLSLGAIEALVNLPLQPTFDSKASRTVFALLRLVENQAAEIVFCLLDEEQSAGARSRQLSLASKLGQGALRAAHNRLGDERWYVVRNACYVLGALSDPELPQRLSPVLRHQDARVQQAALKALLRSKVPGRTAALAGALPALPPHLQEEVLDDLLLLKDSAAVRPLEQFLRNYAAKAGLIEKGVRALAAIECPDATDALCALLDQTLPMPLRDAAFVALKSSPAGLRERFAGLEPPTPDSPSKE